MRKSSIDVRMNYPHHISQLRCVAVECVHNQARFGDCFCNYKIVEVDAGGKCVQYQSKEADNGRQ